MLRLSPPNSKTNFLLDHIEKKFKVRLKNSEFLSLSLPAGISCPGASACKSYVQVKNNERKIIDTPTCKFRCFSASTEVQYLEVYKQRIHNLRQLQRTKNINKLLLDGITESVRLIRLHVSGDFFDYKYLLAWINFAKQRPKTYIYAYTKSLHFLKKLNKNANELTNNIKLVMSHGGKHDDLIPELKKKGFISSRVVYGKQEAKKLGLQIDHDDSLCAFGNKDFALLIHGIQPHWNRCKRGYG